MPNIRLIARLDIKGNFLIKSINLEGLRKIGDPSKYALRYYNDNIDEILYMDVVANLYQRNSLMNLIKETSENIFVPITVGGGVRTLNDVDEMMKYGADKVAINTAAVKDPELIRTISDKFGSQCMVSSIEAKKKKGSDDWEVMIDSGREKTGLCVLKWVETVLDKGAGEILITSVDREGTRTGFDINLIKKVSNISEVPVIASGGMGKIEHLIDVVNKGNADAVAVADILHYDRKTVFEIKNEVKKKNIEMRI